jgi:hypothetical protein
MRPTNVNLPSGALRPREGSFDLKRFFDAGRGFTTPKLFGVVKRHTTSVAMILHR